MASVTCPLCASEVEAELLTYGPLRILERCPTCAGGPIAVNLANAVAPFAVMVTVKLSSANPVQLAKAIKALHPDFSNKSVADALELARESANGGVTFEVPQILFEPLRARWQRITQTSDCSSGLRSALGDRDEVPFVLPPWRASVCLTPD